MMVVAASLCRGAAAKLPQASGTRDTPIRVQPKLDIRNQMKKRNPKV
jgi:hypothetical protein